MPINPFVGRERELERLQQFLEQATAGHAQVVFVIGEAGAGKSALLDEFVRRAEVADPTVAAAIGQCNAQTGVGDAYLPFREVLTALTGADDEKQSRSAVTPTNAARLQELARVSGETLLDVAPDLIGIFVPGASLIAKIVSNAAQRGKLADKLAQRLDKPDKDGANSPTRPTLDQEKIFQQYAKALQALAKEHTLILMLDDLHWADSASLNLLFHLARQLHDSRVLLVGAYRPDDVALGRGGERHPLEPVLNELTRYYGDIVIDLDATRANEGRAFVDALIDAEPNRLDEAFRQELFAHTGGHPLFTLELLRNLQERGDLVQEATGRWMRGATLDWEMIPARVEGVIEERIARVPDDLREVLTIGCVMGLDFAAQVIARVQQVQERTLLKNLARELEKRHHLVQEIGEIKVGQQMLSWYRFTHALVQQFLYSDLSAGERRILHGDVAEALEVLYVGLTDAVSVELAYHFQAAGLVAKAVAYLHQAGNRAVRLSANQEAIAQFTTALELLETLPETPERSQQELPLQLGLGAQLATTRGYAASEVEDAFARARELAQDMERTPQLFPALFGLWRFYLTRAKHHTGRELAEQCLALAEYLQDPALLQQAYHALSFSLCCLGELPLARRYLEQGITLYNPEPYHALAFIYGTDPGVHSLSLLSFELWLLGYPAQALERSKQAFSLAQELSHPMSDAVSLVYAAWLHQFRQEPSAVLALSEATIALCTKHGIMLYLTVATILQGWVLARQGQAEVGITQIRQGLNGFQATGAFIFRPFFLILLAEAYESLGQAEEGLKALDEALALADKGGERLYEAWVYRLQGELLMQVETEAEAKAEACFKRAIEIAQQQGAKSLELRATMSLVRLWQKQGKGEEARQMLTEIYGWFSEGFDTVDLREAKALLYTPASGSM